MSNLKTLFWGFIFCGLDFPLILFYLKKGTITYHVFLKTILNKKALI